MTTPTGTVPADYVATGYKEQPDFSHDVDTMANSHYGFDPHVYMMPVTSPSGFQGQSAAFVQLAAATMTWRYEWTFMREGSRPAVPDPAPLDPNWVLLYESPVLMQENLAIDGLTPIYRLSGTYVYGRKTTPASPYEVACYPRPPWMADEFPRGVPTSLLEKGLSDTTSSTGGTGASPGNPGLVPGGPVRR